MHIYHNGHSLLLTQDPKEPIALGLLPNGTGFVKEGVEYKLGDFMYLHPQVTALI